MRTPHATIELAEVRRRCGSMVVCVLAMLLGLPLGVGWDGRLVRILHATTDFPQKKTGTLVGGGKVGYGFMVATVLASGAWLAAGFGG